MTKTETFDSCTTEFTTLPSNLPFMPPSPFEPITIMSILCECANLVISVDGFPRKTLDPY